MSRWSIRCSALALSCMTACSGASSEPEPTESEDVVAVQQHVVTIDDNVMSRVTFSTTEVVRLATDAPIAVIAELAVDEHHYAIVDAPAPGRVVSLLAHVGDDVADG